MPALDDPCPDRAPVHNFVKASQLILGSHECRFYLPISNRKK